MSQERPGTPTYYGMRTFQVGSSLNGSQKALSAMYTMIFLELSFGAQSQNRRQCAQSSATSCAAS
jgi:hypothetical protein